MASGGRTERLGLNKWGPKDPLFYQEWNDNFQKIDDGHKQVNDKLEESKVGIDSRGISLIDFPRIVPENDDVGRLTRGIVFAENKTLVLPPEEYIINSSVNLISNIQLIGWGAKIVQKTNNTTIFVGNGVSNVTIVGVTFEGVGTDFTKVSGSLARAINIFGTSTNKCENINITDCAFSNFSYAAIAFMFVDKFSIVRNKIIGTGALGNIVKNDNYQFGIWLGQTCYNGVVEYNEVTQTAQGVYTGYDMFNIKFNLNDVHDILGQHGFYISHANTVWITNNFIKKCALMGIKVQQAATSTAISKSVKIMFNDVSECGEHGIVTDNTDTNKTLQLYDVLIGFNIVRNCVADGYSINDLVNSKMVGNKVSNDEDVIADTTKTRHGVIINDCESLEVIDTDVKNTNGVGFFVNSRNKDIKIKRLNVNEAGQANISNTNYGVYVQEGENISFEEVTTTDINNKSLYSFANVNATNLKVRRSKFYGKDVRFFTSRPVEWHDNEVETTIINYPNTIVKGRKCNVYHGTIANAPTDGTGYKNGDRYEFTDPIAGGYVGKILAGSVWKSFGQISN